MLHSPFATPLQQKVFVVQINTLLFIPSFKNTYHILNVFQSSSYVAAGKDSPKYRRKPQKHCEISLGNICTENCKENCDTIYYFDWKKPTVSLTYFLLHGFTVLQKLVWQVHEHINVDTE